MIFLNKYKYPYKTSKYLYDIFILDFKINFKYIYNIIFIYKIKVSFNY